MELLKLIGIAEPSGSGWLTVLLAFVVAAATAWRIIPQVRTYALKAGWADAPNARRINKEPLPNAGGLAIYAGVMVAIIVAAVTHPILIERVLIQMLAILLGGSVLVLVGFIDSLIELPPVFRLVVQLLTAVLLYAVGIKFHIDFAGNYNNMLSLGLTVLWVVGVTNAINLLDGVDGLAGGISFITAMAFLVASAQNPTWAAGTLVLAGLAGSALGYLRHNFHPSRIIMGDSGTYFFGYVLAATALVGSPKMSNVFALVPVAMYLLLPIVDMTRVFAVRLSKGKNPLSTPGKDHFHHILLAKGFSQTKTTVTIWSINLLVTLVALAINKVHIVAMVCYVLAVVGLLAFTVWRKALFQSKHMASEVGLQMQTEPNAEHLSQDSN